MRWCGQQGCFWRSIETIAKALGKSVRQVKSDIAALEREGLLAHVRRGNRMSNVYTVLWHPMFESEVQSAAHQESASTPPAEQSGLSSEVQDSPCEVQSNVKSNVQPTAHEFSPLLNCVQNLVRTREADYSQRLAKTDESSADHRSRPVDRLDNNREVDASVDAGDDAEPVEAVERSQVARLLSQKAKPEELVKLRGALIAYMGETPPDGFEESCLLRARGATVSDLVDLITRRWRANKHRPGSRCGPQSWNWFLTVIGNEFSALERARFPETVAMPHPCHQVSADRLARGIEAIETSPADSLVCSYRCKCGAEIRQYETRIEGTCTCSARRKQARPLSTLDGAQLSPEVQLEPAFSASLLSAIGSTLIGCERRGRKAGLMEIDPKYSDCIVQRYQEYTGKQGVLEGDGRAFSDVARERREEAA